MNIYKIQMTDGAEIYCECYGDKLMPALLLLHGNGENLHYFDPQIPYFSTQYHVIAIDSRGHGKSSRGSNSMNFNTLSQDVLEVLNALHIERANILGFSDGANIALYLALLAPKRISSMILSGANYSPAGLRFRDRLFIVLYYYCLVLVSLFSASLRKKKEIWNLMIHHPNLTIREISQILVPTLIITGENDMVSQKQNDEMHKVIIGSGRIIIPKTDHFVSNKHPEIFNPIIESFLQKIV